MMPCSNSEAALKTFNCSLPAGLGLLMVYPLACHVQWHDAGIHLLQDQSRLGQRSSLAIQFSCPNCFELPASYILQHLIQTGEGGLAVGTFILLERGVLLFGRVL